MTRRESPTRRRLSTSQKALLERVVKFRRSSQVLRTHVARRDREPNLRELTDLVGRFDAIWREEFEELLSDDDERLKRELAFMGDRRNRIARGLNEGITRDKALMLKEVAAEVADWFILRFNPT